MRFQRSARNPILRPGTHWWEARAVFNPGVALYEDRIAMVYRAVGADGISRFGLRWSEDGERFHPPQGMTAPWYEGALDDPMARLGVEDPRITALDGRYYLTYCKASVDTANHEPLSWETAPFRVRTGLGVTDDFSAMHEIDTILPGTNTKDTVLFPARVGGRYAALTRIYPSIQYITSTDLTSWSDPVTVMEPVAGTWEGERIGAGPPPFLTEWGWLLLYHGNEYLRMPGNQRVYRMGLAVLDRDEPWRVLYRHPEPVFSPDAPYEVEGPVGNVVFGTAVVPIGDRYALYYGAGDGVIGVAWAEKQEVAALLERSLP